MNIVSIDNKKWVVGIEWQILPGETDDYKDEIKEASRKAGKNFGVTFDYDDVRVLGLLDKKVKEPVAAAYAARANQKMLKKEEEEENESGSPTSNPLKDWIIVEEVGDHYWLCAIKNGIPLPGFDVVEDLDQIKNKIFELLEVDTYTIYTKSERVDELLRGSKFTEPKSLFDLIEEAKFDKTDLSKVKVSQLVGIDSKYLIVVIAVFGVIILGYFLNDFIQNQSLASKAKQLQEQQMRQKLLEKQQFEQKMREYDKQVEQAKQNALQNVQQNINLKNKEILNNWVNPAINLNVSTGGWNVNKYLCNVVDATSNNQTATGCYLLLNRTDYGTDQMLLAVFPKAKIIGNTARIDITIPNSNLNDTSASTSAPQVAEPNALLDNNISTLQQLKMANITYSISKQDEITYPVPAKPLTADQMRANAKPVIPPPVGLGIYKGIIQITGSNLLFLKDAINLLSYSSVAINNLDAEINYDDQKWMITFNYYTNAPLPLDSKVLSDDSANQAATPATPASAAIAPPGANNNANGATK
jgi:hypothetical protein